MSGRADPDPGAPGPPGGGPGGPGRIDEHDARRIAILVGIAVGVLLLLVFIVQNTRQVRVSFVFFDSEMSLIWVIVLSAITGWVVGFLVARLIRKRFFPPKPG